MRAIRGAAGSGPGKSRDDPAVADPTGVVALGRCPYRHGYALFRVDRR